MTLRKYFDRVVLINLRRRPDRLAQVQRTLRQCDWPFKQPEVFEAVDGSEMSVPKGWKHGHGAWGAKISHQRVLEAAHRDRVNNLLVLEDDICFINNFRSRIRDFLLKVPDDWDQLMIGGQHMHRSGSPTLLRPGVYRCADCERMHCFAIRGEFMVKFHQRLLGGGKFDGLAHCDWILSRDPELQLAHNVYAPEFFLVGQERSRSDITGMVTPRKFWNAPGPDLSVIHLSAPPPVALALLRQGFYWRHTFNDKDGKAQTLSRLLRKTETGASAIIGMLREWIKAIQWEIANDPLCICTIWHPQVTLEMVEAASLWQVYGLTANSVEDAIDQLPIKLRKKFLQARLFHSRDRVQST